MSVVLTQEECLVCDRIGVGTYYRELRQFGFKREDALKVLKCLAALYFKDPILMAGRKRATIKCAVTYVAAAYLGYDRTRNEVALFFTGNRSVNQTFRPLVKVIKEKYLPTMEQAIK